MFEKLIKSVNKLVNFNDSEKEIFQQAFSHVEVPKNKVLIKEGEIAKEIFFINKGLLRLYYNNDGNLITAFIFREGLFASSYASFLESSPSAQSLDTLEDCELLVLTKENLERLYQDLPKINILTRKIAEQRFLNSQRILSSFLLDTPEERYAKFAETNSDLFLRVPHHMIASYLGITPVSLSRIRKRLQEK